MAKSQISILLISLSTCQNDFVSFDNMIVSKFIKRSSMSEKTKEKQMTQSQEALKSYPLRLIKSHSRNKKSQYITDRNFVHCVDQLSHECSCNHLLHHRETESVFKAISLAFIVLPAGTPGSYSDKRKTGAFPPEVGTGRKRKLCVSLQCTLHSSPAQTALV